MDGETYVKQYMPPSVTDMGYSAESLVAEMDYAGVDMAMIHRTPYLGIGNDFTAECCRRFPDRLQGLAHVEEWLAGTDVDGSIAKLERAIACRACTASSSFPTICRSTASLRTGPGTSSPPSGTP